MRILPSIFLFLLVLSVMPLASAQAFDTEFQSDGLRILGPENFPLKQNTGFNFTFHVFNTTLGEKVDPSDAECNFFLMGKNGNVQIERINISKADRFFYIFVQGNNFTEMSEHDYLVKCAATEGDLSGGTRTSFEVTADGDKFQAFPNEFFFIILSGVFIFMSYFNDRMALFRYLGGALMMVLGVLTIYPGYNFINHTNLLGISMGSILIALGFFFLIEDAFSRKQQASHYDDSHSDEKDEVEINEDLFDEE